MTAAAVVADTPPVDASAPPTDASGPPTDASGPPTDASAEPPAASEPALTASGLPNPHGLPDIAVDRPEVAVGAAFAGGLVFALILKRLAR